MKDDLGEEMYFIVEGKALIMNNHDSKVIVTLTNGNYFGEIALFSENCRRTCSVISGSITELYILEKNDFEEVLSQFPNLINSFKNEGNRRLIDYKLRHSTNINIKTKESEYQKQEEEEAKKNEESDSFSEEEKEEEIEFLKKSTSKVASRKNLKVQITLPNEEEDEVKKEIEMVNQSPPKFQRFPRLKTLKSALSTPKSSNTIIRIENNDEEKILSEFVDTDEFNDELKLQSRRVRCWNNKERRFSRVTFGQNLLLSKSSELSMQWGISSI